MTVRKVVIPVAGVGTRLLPVTKSQPKEMLPVGRKPVVQYVMEEAEAAGLKQILFITGRKKTWSWSANWLRAAAASCPRSWPTRTWT